MSRMTPNIPGARLGIERREEILRFIDEYLARERVAPTREDIAAHLHVSTSAAKKHVALLVDEGSVEDMGGTRGLRLTSP